MKMLTIRYADAGFDNEIWQDWTAYYRDFVSGDDFSRVYEVPGSSQFTLRGDFIGEGEELSNDAPISMLQLLNTEYGTGFTISGFSLSLSELRRPYSVENMADRMNLGRRVFGSGQDDEIDGGWEDDKLFGMDGDDILLDYGASRDKLYGGAGDDTLIGGEWADAMEGGSGEDIFAYETFYQSSREEPDTITDFTPGTDKLDFSTIKALNLRFIGLEDFSGNKDQLRFEHTLRKGEVVTIVEGNDKDARSRGAEFFLVLSGDVDLTRDDFFL